MFFARRIHKVLSRSRGGSLALDWSKRLGIYEFFWRMENRRIVRRYRGQIDRICDSLADDLSKKTYRALLEYRCRGSRASHRQVQAVKLPGCEQYFPDDIFQLGDQESFVDCGAYVGDTLGHFLRRVPGGKYQAVFAFEPNKMNLEVLRAYVADHHLAKVSIHNLGTYCKRDVLKFKSSSQGDMGGAIHSEGGEDVMVDSLDNVLGDTAVTFIKMDVEGAELHSLRGAKGLILKNKPKLAICIYHKTVDFIEIPEYLHQLVPEYRFYVRHYTDSRLETVLYAVLSREANGRAG